MCRIGRLRIVTEGMNIIEAEDKSIVKVGNDLFELSVCSGKPKLCKLPIWKKYSLAEPFFVKDIDENIVVVSARGRDDVFIDKKIFDSSVAVLFDTPEEFVGFFPEPINDKPYDGGVEVNAETKNAPTCPECFVTMDPQKSVVCEVCGKRLCSHCIIRSRYNRFEQNLCPDCYYQKRSAAVILND